VGFLLVGVWGYWALLTTPIDAIPDLSDNQVIVFIAWPGRSSQEVEDQITYPLTVSLQGLPGVRVVRSSSAFGFSVINIIFEEAVELYFARTRVLERLNLLANALPLLCSLFIGGRIRREEEIPVMRPLMAVYRPLLGWALRHRALTLGGAVVIFASALALIPRIAKEFMPLTDPAISLSQAIDITKKQNAAMAAFPEVNMVVAKIARAETSTDPAPVNMTETIVSLMPESAWRPRMTREKLIAELDAATTLPGVSNIWTQPIINHINMLTTGIRSEVGVKIFGHDLKALEERARAVADVLRHMPGAADVYPEKVTGAPYLDIRVKREAAAHYGITVGAMQDVIETAVGETNLTMTIEGRQRFPVRVRYAPEFRGSAEALAGLPVPAPSGAQIPLGQLADIRHVSGHP
jgi:Cu(I)/Ag(I) efflux system membrane protein CusA/SilA